MKAASQYSNASPFLPLRGPLHQYCRGSCRDRGSIEGAGIIQGVGVEQCADEQNLIDFNRQTDAADTLTVSISVLANCTGVLRPRLAALACRRRHSGSGISRGTGWFGPVRGSSKLV